MRAWQASISAAMQVPGLGFRDYGRSVRPCQASIPAAMHAAWLVRVAQMPMTGRRRRPCSASLSRSWRVAVD